MSSKKVLKISHLSPEKRENIHKKFSLPSVDGEYVTLDNMTTGDEEALVKYVDFLALPEKDREHRIALVKMHKYTSTFFTNYFIMTVVMTAILVFHFCTLFYNAGFVMDQVGCNLLEIKDGNVIVEADIVTKHGIIVKLYDSFEYKDANPLENSEFPRFVECKVRFNTYEIFIAKIKESKWTPELHSHRIGYADDYVPIAFMVIAVALGVYSYKNNTEGLKHFIIAEKAHLLHAYPELGEKENDGRSLYRKGDPTCLVDEDSIKKNK